MESITGIQWLGTAFGAVVFLLGIFYPKWKKLVREKTIRFIKEQAAELQPSTGPVRELVQAELAAEVRK